MSRGVRIAALTVVLGAALFVLAHPLDLTTADLGRHLKNGEIILGTRAVPGTNLYSYTNPDFPFVNHHWGSGVVFFLVARAGGFPVLHGFFIALTLATLFLYFRMAWSASSFETAAFVALPLVPVLVTRPEVRPEAFSYLFAGLFLWILWRHAEPWAPMASASGENIAASATARQASAGESRSAGRLLLWLPALEIFWVNLHIYFFFGPMLIGLFLIEALVTAWRDGPAVRSGDGKSAAASPRSPTRADLRWSRAKRLAVVLFLSIAATLLNPAGLEGALYPFRIFGNYGQAVFENQSLLWVEANYSFPAGLYFKIGFVLLLVSWIYAFAARRRVSIALLLLSVVISALGWQAIRNFGLFALIALPITAANLRGAGERIRLSLRGRRGQSPVAERGARDRPENVRSASRRGGLLFAALVLWGAALVLARPSFWQGRGPLRLGLLPGMSNAAEFFLSRGLRGPIFNNYDIGAYLIDYLYPRERVFVDNRPEAYPGTFFTDTYAGIQEGGDGWQRAMRDYRFESLILTRRTLAPRARAFLESRARDPLWAVVYADSRIVIFLRRDGPHQDVIRDYELCLAEFPIR